MELVSSKLRAFITFDTTSSQAFVVACNQVVIVSVLHEIENADFHGCCKK